MKTSDDADDVQALTQDLTTYTETYLARRLGIADNAGLQVRRFKSDPVNATHCAICCAGMQVSDGYAFILFDGEVERGPVCEVCVAGGPAGAAQRACKYGDEIVNEGLRVKDLGQRLAEGVPRWEYGGARNSRVDDAAERDRVRHTLATWHRGIKA